MTRSFAHGRRVGLRHAVAQAFEQLEGRRLMCAIHEEFLADAAFIDPADYALSEALATSASAQADAAPGMPDLNSLPSAPAAIYLDFDGQGTRAPYDTDGDGATFNAAEAAAITTAWSRVSAYFAMFNVNVTTTKPTVPFAWQLTTPDEGGWSYVGVFPNSPTGNPQSFNNSSSITGRTSAYAHELGHNFGMQHQAEWDSLGVRTAEYTDGYDNLHGSIMGTDYARNVRKWLIGHDTTSDGAYTLQDDLSIVANDLDNYGGDGYRPDDYLDTTGGATPLTVSGTDQLATGVIERRTDVDTFSFTSTGGRYLVEAGRAVESGADLKIEILDSTGKLIAARDIPDQNETSIAIDLPAGTYFVNVAGHGNYGDQGMYKLRVSPIAAGFQSTDVGNIRLAGNTTYNPTTGVWTLLGGGSAASSSTSSTDVTTFDELRYAYSKLNGDGTIVARVASFGGTDADAYAGIMIRESLAQNSKFAAATLAPSSIVRFTRRSTDGASYTNTNATSVAGPYWLKLTRVGNLFTAFRSVNGTTWTSAGSATVAMGANVFIGLATSSHVDQATISSTFDNVSLTGAGIGGAPTTLSPSLAAPATVSVALAAGSGLAISWAAVADAISGYVIQRSTDGSNFDDIATVGAAATTYTDAGLAGSYRYFYRVLSLDTIGRSIASATANAINRPSAVTSIKTMSISASRVVVDWIDTVGESFYKVERSADNGATWITLTSTLALNRPSYTDASVTTTKVYQYRVTPLSTLGDGVTSTVVTEGSRLAAVTPTLSAITANSMTLNWTDLNTLETAYKIQRSVDGETWTTLTSTLGANVTTYTATGLTAQTEYYFRVQAVSAYTESLFSPVSAVTTGAGIPAPWTSGDMGALDPSLGSTTYASSVFTIGSGGTDIGGTTDQFRFVYQPLTLNGSITAQITSLTGPVGAEVGLMFRSSLTANSPYALAMLTNNADSRFMRRSTAGGATTSTDGPDRADATNVIAPYWLRLTRAGDLITADQSVDGVVWVTMGSATVALGANIYAGMVVSSHSATVAATAGFSNVSFVQGSIADVVAPIAPVFTSIGSDTGSSATDRITSDNTLVFTGTAEANSTVTLSLDGAPIGTTVTSAGGVWSYDYTDTELADGTYTLSAFATDAADNDGPLASTTVVIDTTAPAAVSALFDREWGHKWQVTFADDVSGMLSGSDFAIVNRETGASVTPQLTSYNAATKTAYIEVPISARLADGYYELRVVAGAATDVAGNASAQFGKTFEVLDGDMNGSGKVDFDDLLTLARHYGTTGWSYSSGNLDYGEDGNVGFNDLLILARAYGRSLAAFTPPAPLAATLPAATTTRKRATASFSDSVIA